MCFTIKEQRNGLEFRKVLCWGCNVIIFLNFWSLRKHCVVSIFISECRCGQYVNISLCVSMCLSIFLSMCISCHLDLASDLSELGHFFRVNVLRQVCQDKLNPLRWSQLKWPYEICSPFFIFFDNIKKLLSVSIEL